MMPPKPSVTLINGGGVFPISYSIREDETSKLANDDNNEVPVISPAFPSPASHSLSKVLAIESKQILPCGPAPAVMGAALSGLGQGHFPRKPQGPAAWLL